MLILFLVVLGVFSFMDLGVDLFPQSDPATVYVRMRLPGASPEEMVSQVVLPVEEAVASVSGIEELRAMVMEGTANIMVTFVLERPIALMGNWQGKSKMSSLESCMAWRSGWSGPASIACQA